jgi:hypothetical protein
MKQGGGGGNAVVSTQLGENIMDYFYMYAFTLIRTCQFLFFAYSHICVCTDKN